MGQFDYLTARKKRKSVDCREYKCPYCGAQCHINMTECPDCKNSLTNFESWQFEKYGLYNEALECCRQGNYLNALEKLAIFLASYPNDRDGSRLRIFVLYELDDLRLDEIINSYIGITNDKWAAEFQDDPKGFTLDDFREKEAFEGEFTDKSMSNPAVAVLLSETKNVERLVEVVNGMYELYDKCRRLHSRKRNKRTSEFLHFYETTFDRYLYRMDIDVVDYFKKNFNELSEEQQKLFGEVRPIRDKRLEPGTVNRVYIPEIRFKSMLLQRAVIEVVVPSKKKRR